jgi:hypothetical protein
MRDQSEVAGARDIICEALVGLEVEDALRVLGYAASCVINAVSAADHRVRIATEFGRRLIEIASRERPN